VGEALVRTVRAADEEARRAGAARFFEVYNGHRSVNNAGNAKRPSTEKIWDLVLAARLATPGSLPLYAVATDDTHHYHQAGAVAAPFRGWIRVKAPSSTPPPSSRR
jgi:hypothetical protein